MKTSTHTTAPYALLAKYFTKECSVEELVQVRSWIEENVEEFNELDAIWHASAADPKTISSSMRRTWKSIRRQHQSLSEENGRRCSPWFRLSSVAAAAAAVVLLAGAFFMGRNTMKVTGPQMLIVSTQPGQKAEITLPDSTHIWLNSGTSIAYPSDYNINNRNVTLLEGEAFFDVTHSDDHKFLLSTADGVGVKVYGTEFNVNSYAETPEVTVTLKNGHVDVLRQDGSRMSELVPGQKLTWNRDLEKYSVTDCDAEGESIWRYVELRIDRQPLDKVIWLMEKWYGVNITLAGASDDNRLYWMTIKTESMREMLDLLNAITPIDYQIQGKEVIVSIKNT